MEKEKFFSEKHNFPWEQWIFLGEKPKFPKEKDTSSGEQFIFPKGKPKFLGKTYVTNLFAIIVILFLFIYSYDLSLERSWQEIYFVIWNISKNSYAKVTIKQNLEHICSLGQLKLLLPKGHDCSQWKRKFKLLPRQLKLLLPKDMIVPQQKPTSSRDNELPLKKSSSSSRKYMFRIFFAITIFSSYI
jgi:hypothetical protein